MSHLNVIALDLAKNSIQVCRLNKHNNVTLNKAMSRIAAHSWLHKQPPSIVAMEACSSAHHWARTVTQMGHTPRIIPCQHVKPFRQGHKTDATDCVAIAEACLRPNLHFVSVKSIDQQNLQSLERIRKHLTDGLVAHRNMMRSLLAEFGLTTPKGVSKFDTHIAVLLSDPPESLSAAVVEQIRSLYDLCVLQTHKLKEAVAARDGLARCHPSCQALQRLPSIGPVNAIGLFLQLGERGGNFAHGREASASIGVTPRQYSTGGKVTMMGIGKKRGNQALRSSLIQGAVSMVKALQTRPPRTETERWLANLIAKGSTKKAAVALANKIIRHAWALLHYGEEFDWGRHQPLEEVSA